MVTAAPSPNLQLLVVEDDLPTQAFLRGILTKQGFQVHCASDGQQAIAMLMEQRIDLMVTDLQMAGMDGHQLLDYMAEHYPLVPKIVLTGSSTLMTMLDCLRQGALAFCTKPLGDGKPLLQAITIAVDLVNHRKQQLHHLVRNNRQQRERQA